MSARCSTNRTGRAIRHPWKFDGGCQIEKAMEKQESKNRFPTFPQPRLLRNTLSYGIRIQGATPPGLLTFATTSKSGGALQWKERRHHFTRGKKSQLQ